MARTEMDHVQELDTDLVLNEAVSDRLHFYYGLTDGWCPVRYGDRMRELLDDHCIHFDEHGCDHVFVIHYSRQVAQECANIISGRTK